MSDHAEIIREALMWAQAYVPDRVCHRLLDAEESLRGLLADHAAETERLTAEADGVKAALAACKRIGAHRHEELVDARAENERLTRAVESQKRGWFNLEHELQEARAENERLQTALRNCMTNDRSKPYDYRETRPYDGQKPAPGKAFNTPFQIARAALAAAQEPPAEGDLARFQQDFYIDANREWVYRWSDLRLTLDEHSADKIKTATWEPPADTPDMTGGKPVCYVCGHPVADGEGWRRDGKAWCPDHRPVWSHD